MKISKRTNFFYIYYVILIMLTAVLSYFAYSASIGISKWGFSITGTVLFIFPIIILFLLYQKFSRDANAIQVDRTNKIITFKSFFLRIKTNYNFEQLQGYVTGRFIGDNRSLTKVIWIVKDGKMLRRINENHVANMSELEAEFKELKYLGYQTISLAKRIKLVFAKLKIDK